MEITDTQKETIRQWISEDCGLAEIQRRLQSEFQMSMTYMDVRFLLIDLGLAPKDRKEAPAPAPPAPAAPAGPGGVSVEVDMVTKPGTIVSGTVDFSDGVSAAWSLDQQGRLALSATKPGYKPSEEDLRAFQDGLRVALEKRGF